MACTILTAAIQYCIFRPERVVEPKQSTPQALQRYLNRVPDRKALCQVLVVRRVKRRGLECKHEIAASPITPDPFVSVAERLNDLS